MAGTTSAAIDQDVLTGKVQDMYRAVARTPAQEFHFETGRALAERLGYPPEDLDRIPPGAIESFAGVGWFFDLADLQAGEAVLDLGSGSGMDAFFAALRVGPTGRVAGIDMTDAQLEKAERLREEHGIDHVAFRAGRIEQLPFPDAVFDAVISNGVINLTPDKEAVFAEAARVLRPGGRLAIADIVTEEALTEAIVSNVDLWASCIGGAPRREVYERAITAAGLRVEHVRPNRYEFLSEQARNASEQYGVRSVSVLARKP
ncbi:methyltransferase domain-containing protein [Blastococcus sp. MG754426]|uniref:methyltransferase domain-containing protein n=1 Tax=unclassified Blastococcus TaxID=2619396 RepID=UPI001EEFA56E|nr:MULTISPECIES: methyltransferase domain-containing protein [unclassified Blastococcus]MCF6506635.1 methyltransferase domain-containing protein [Blastococcus sp. MG754426]MCF6510347.1 methyltransferase domain-containing protein [Blastococcus sp. MG754427]MCF6735735.1 methyltransferase domain-containing protein [Blastococcus sp. KM273129]